MPAAGYPFTLLPGRGIQRRLTLANPAALLGPASAPWARDRPRRAACRPRSWSRLGGYASLPVRDRRGAAADAHRVAEQNARPGAANRAASPASPGRRRCPSPARACRTPVVTGNPVRADILAVDRARDRAAARAALGMPPDRRSWSRVRRLARAPDGSTRRRWCRARCGPGGPTSPSTTSSASATADEVERRRPRDRRTAASSTAPVDYEDHMALALAAADLAVSRAGGDDRAPSWPCSALPAILVPLPSPPRDHQTANAAALVDGGRRGARPRRGAHRGSARRASSMRLLGDPVRRARDGRRGRRAAVPSPRRAPTTSCGALADERHAGALIDLAAPRAHPRRRRRWRRHVRHRRRCSPRMGHGCQRQRPAATAASSTARAPRHRASTSATIRRTSATSTWSRSRRRSARQPRARRRHAPRDPGACAVPRSSPPSPRPGAPSRSPARTARRRRRRCWR